MPGPRLRRPWAHVLVAGAALALVACIPSTDLLGGDGLVAHMARHLVLLDLAPVLLLVGVGVDRLPHVPLAAGGIGATLLVLGWHFPAAFDLTLGRGAVHVLEHLTFVVAGLLLWLPVVSPRTGAAAAFAFLFLTRNAQMVLGNVLLWMPHPLYERSGSLHQQRLAAAMMLSEGLVVGLAAAGRLFACLMQEGRAPEAAARPGGSTTGSGDSSAVRADDVSMRSPRAPVHPRAARDGG